MRTIWTGGALALTGVSNGLNALQVFVSNSSDMRYVALLVLALIACLHFPSPGSRYE